MYEDLLENLQQAQAELEQFDEKYPELAISHIFPGTLIVAKLSEFARQCSEEHHNEVAYLDYDELADEHGIDVGTSVKKHDQFGVDRAYEQIDRAQDRFLDDLKLLCDRYKAELLYLSLKISGATATNTARLIDARHTLAKKVDKCSNSLNKYYVKKCTRFRAMSGLNVDIYYHTDDVPVAKGIYFLMGEGDIIYIGRSANIHKRISNHDVVRKYYSKNSERGYNIVCGVYQSDDDLSDLEGALIRVAKPEYNVQSKDI
jgi:hypothetical protein